MSALYEMACALEAVASDPPPHHWIGGGDAASNYCRACAEIKVAELSAADPAGEFWVDGGREAHEEDGCAYCDQCQRLTSYTLTDYGVRDELAHFEEFATEPTVDLHPDTFYEILRICASAYPEDGELASRAVAVASDHLAAAACRELQSLLPAPSLREGRRMSEFIVSPDENDDFYEVEVPLPAPTLIERLQAADRGSRSLDAEIFGLVVLSRSRAGRVFPDERPDAPEIANHVPKYTTSLDAVVVLAEREWGPCWSVAYSGSYYTAEAQAYPPFVGRHVRPAIALCIAVLLAVEETRATADGASTPGTTNKDPS